MLAQPNISETKVKQNVPNISTVVLSNSSPAFFFSFPNSIVISMLSLEDEQNPV